MKFKICMYMTIIILSINYSCSWKSKKDMARDDAIIDTKNDTTIVEVISPEWALKEDSNIQNLIEENNYNILSLQEELNEFDRTLGISGETFYKLTKIDIRDLNIGLPSIGLGRVLDVGNGCYVVFYDMYSCSYNYCMPVVYDEAGMVADYEVFLENKVSDSGIVFTNTRIMLSNKNENNYLNIEVFGFDTLNNFVKYPYLDMRTDYTKYIINNACELQVTSDTFVEY